MSTGRNEEGVSMSMESVHASLEALIRGPPFSPGSEVSHARTSADRRTQPSGPPQSPPVEGLLGDIANRLAGIEGMYEEVASRLVANERTVRELRVTGGGGGAKGVVMTPGRPVMTPPGPHTHTTPPRGSISLNPPTGGLLSLPHQQQQPVVAATVQQHSSQIHKLIAGLDFLEQHIIRHDAAIDGIAQRQALFDSSYQPSASWEQPGLTDSRQGSLDNSSVVNKLLIELQDDVTDLKTIATKADRQGHASDARAQLVTSQISQLASRLAVLEHEFNEEGGGTRHRKALNPLFDQQVSKGSLSKDEVAEMISSHLKSHSAVTAEKVAFLEKRVEALEEELAKERVKGEALAVKVDSLPSLPSVDDFEQLKSSVDVALQRMQHDVVMLTIDIGKDVEKLTDELAVLSVVVEKKADESNEAVKASDLRAAELAQSMAQSSGEATRRELIAVQDHFRTLHDDLESHLGDLKESFFGLASMQGQSMREVDDRVRLMVEEGVEVWGVTVTEALRAQVVEVAGKMEGLAGEVYDIKLTAEAAKGAAEAAKDDVQAGLLAVGGQVVDLADRVQQGDLDSLEAVRQAQVRIGNDLALIRSLANDADMRARANVTQVDLEGLVAIIEEMQEGLRRVEGVQEGMQVKMANVIDHQKLSEIFRARDGMRLAMEQLGRVFATGTLGEGGEAPPSDPRGGEVGRMRLELEELRGSMATLAAQLGPDHHSKASKRPRLYEEGSEGEGSEAMEQRLEDLEARVERLTYSSVDDKEAIKSLTSGVLELQLMLMDVKSTLVGGPDLTPEPSQYRLFEATPGSLASVNQSVNQESEHHRYGAESEEDGIRLSLSPHRQGPDLEPSFGSPLLSPAASSSRQGARAYVQEAAPSLSLLTDLARKVDDQSDAVDACIGTLKDVKESIEHLQLLVVELRGERASFSPTQSPLASPSSHLPPTSPNPAQMEELAQMAKTASNDVGDLTELVALLQEDVGGLRSQLRAKKILDSPNNASWAQAEHGDHVMMTGSGIIEQVLIPQSNEGSEAFPTRPPQTSGVTSGVDFHLDILSLKRSIQELSEEVKEVRGVAEAALTQAGEAQEQAASALEESEAPLAQLAFLGTNFNSLNESLDEMKSILDHHEERLISFRGQKTSGDEVQGDQNGSNRLSEVERVVGEVRAAVGGMAKQETEGNERIANMLRMLIMHEKSIEDLSMSASESSRQLADIVVMQGKLQLATVEATHAAEIAAQAVTSHGPIDPPQPGLSAQALAAASADALDALDGKISAYGQVLQAMRDRLLSLQEYCDGTRESVKEVGAVQSSLLTRLDGLEAGGGGGRGCQVSDPSDLKEVLKPVQHDISELQARLQVVQEASLASSKSIEGLPVLLAKRMDEAEKIVEEVKAKMAAIGQTLPVLVGQIQGVEQRVEARSSRSREGLEVLTRSLEEVPNIQKPSMKNPFALIAPGINPAVIVLEMRFEAMRQALIEYNKAAGSS